MADEKKPLEVGDRIFPPEDGGDAKDGDNTEDYGGYTPDSDVVKLASSHGWKPKNEHKGDREWVDPYKFVDAQWIINGATKNANKNLERQVDQLTQKLNQVTQHFDEMNRREQDKVHSELKAMKVEAIKEGDADKVEEIDAKISELKETAPSRGNAADPAISQWLTDNPWYRPEGQGADADVSDVIELVEELNTQYKDLSPKFRLAKIDREVADYIELRRPELKEKYKFAGIRQANTAAPKDDDAGERKERKAISDVEGNAVGGSRRGKDITYSQLTPEEKAACDSTVAEVQGMTREKWLAGYSKLRG